MFDPCAAFLAAAVRYADRKCGRGKVDARFFRTCVLVYLEAAGIGGIVALGLVATVFVVVVPGPPLIFGLCFAPMTIWLGIASVPMGWVQYSRRLRRAQDARDLRLMLATAPTRVMSVLGVICGVAAVPVVVARVSW